MTRATLLLVAALVGCGGGSRVTAPATPQRPPPIALESRAGSQRAVQGSSCVRSGGAGVCGDTGYPAPMQLSVVRPGEDVRVRVRGGSRIQLEVHRFGCHAQPLRRIGLGADGRWHVDLRPGAYELVVFVGHFETAQASGDTSGGVGLWVSETRRLEVLPADTVRTLCPS